MDIQLYLVIPILRILEHGLMVISFILEIMIAVLVMALQKMLALELGEMANGIIL